jgi:hypothetical protein
MQSSLKWTFVGSAILLIILGILQNPQPVGFETRPSSEVPTYFFPIFVLALILDIACIPVGIWRTRMTWIIAPVAALFNVLPPVADQAHLLHNAPTPALMLITESLAIIISLLLVYLGFRGRK